MFNRFMKLGQKKTSKPDANGTNVTAVTTRSSVPNADQQPVAASPAPAPLPFNPVIEDLPKFRDVYSSERLNLFIRKTQLCCVLCDFTNNLKIREKEIKAKTLMELVDFIQTDSSKMNEQMQENLMRMISMNIFRCLPPASYENTGCLPGGSDPEEDEPFMEPAWPHLQFVYELLLRYIVSCDRDIKTAKRFIDHTFVFKLVDLFYSEDPRERDYLKMVLHRIYGKFMVHRPYIRSAINNVFYRFVFETERHSGIGELLEILGSIINGFALPMKEEHKLFLVRALLPLHKPKNMSWYHQQLSYCVIQFVEKDFTLADTVIKALLKFWPVTNCQKEVLFLGELEEILEATQLPEFQQIMLPLFRQIARCLNSSHFQVAERALFLWNNEHLVGLISHNRDVIFPIILDALEKNMESHWNQAVHGLTANVRRMFMEMDADLYEECQKQYEEKEAEVEKLEEQRELKWKQLEAQAGGD